MVLTARNGSPPLHEATEELASGPSRDSSVPGLPRSRGGAVPHGATSDRSPGRRSLSESDRNRPGQVRGEATGVSALHIYTRPHQPATRFVDRSMPGRGHWFRYPGGRLLSASCCGRMRPARNLTVQVYYDSVPFFCRPGTGCRKPSRRKRVTGRRLVREFLAGRSVLGLARRFGMPCREVEARIRRMSR